MTTRWYLSDVHHDHNLVAGIRGFGSREEPDVAAHNAAIAAAWDRVVKADDHVYIAGDIAMNPYKGDTFKWFQERPGTKILIAGNHDEVHPANSKSVKALRDPRWTETFHVIQPFLRIKVGGKTVLISHFPYEGEGGRENITERWPEYRLRDEGALLLHGHTHDRLTSHYSEKGTPQFHIGLDAHGLQLVSEATIAEWVEAHSD